MNSYKSLRIVSSFFNVLAYITLFSGALLAFYGIEINLQNPNMSPAYAIIYGIAVAVGALVAFVLFMAIAQLIKLFINIADDVKNMDNNIYAIASKQ